jgi:thymidylate synthase (FAD)
MKRSVLNKGKVELVDRMGNDMSILRAARVSTGAEVSKGDEKDRGLIRYLYRNDHISPFAFVSFQFYFKMPIFVARQFFRHRSMDFNEASARYKEFEWEVFYPEEWRAQDTKENIQGSDGIIDHQELTTSMVEGVYSKNKDAYESMLGHNVAREQARTVMPVGQYTEFYAHVNLRNLFHFLELRLDEHAQYEIRVYAEAILSILKELKDIKWSIEIFEEMYNLKQLFNKSINASNKRFKSFNQIEIYLKDFIRANKEK